MTNYLDVEDVERLHQIIARRAYERELGGGPYGVKNRAALESAVYCPRQTLFGEDAYPSIFQKAAALARSLACNHAFHNGNKRTALLATVAFLRHNGYEFGLADREAATLATKAHLISIALDDTLRLPEAQEKLLRHVYLRVGREYLAELIRPQRRAAWSGEQRDAIQWSVALDWETQNFARSYVVAGKDTVESATQRTGDWLVQQVLNTALKTATFGFSQVRRQSSTSIGIGRQVGDYFEALPDDEKEFVIEAIFFPCVIAREKFRLVDHFEEIATNAEIDLDPARRGRYRDHLEFLDAQRSLFEGLGLAVYPDNDDGEPVEIELQMQISPLTVDHVNERAFYPLEVGFITSNPKIVESLTDEDRLELLEQMKGTVDELFEKSSAIMIETVKALLAAADKMLTEGPEEFRERYEATLREEVEHSGDYSIPPLDESIPQHRPMIGEIWKFVVKIVEEKLETDEIATWLEKRAVKVEST